MPVRGGEGATGGSLVADVVLDAVDARVEADGVLLHDDFLLDERVHLLLEEVALVDVGDLQLLEVLLEVGDVLDDLLEDVVRGLGGVVLQRGALRAQQLHLLLVVVKQLDRLLGVPLHTRQPLRTKSRQQGRYLRQAR